MKEKKAWLIPLGIALLIAALVSARQGFSLSQPLGENCRDLSDGCFVAGLLFTGVGLLMWISTTGIFDIFGYAMRSLLVLFSPLRDPKDHPTFYDFKMKREEKRKRPLRTVLWVGLIFVALSLVFLGGYYIG